MTDNGQVPAPPGKLHKIDPARLKLRELAEVEKLLGRRIAGELQSGDLGMDTMQGLVWVELRRQDPAATFEQAGEYDLGTLFDAFADDDEAEAGPLDPTRPPSPASSDSSGNGATSSKARPPSTVSGG
jgi:hypothetical protein